jgi:hypothetical protein
MSASSGPPSCHRYSSRIEAGREAPSARSASVMSSSGAGGRAAAAVFGACTASQAAYRGRSSDMVFLDSWCRGDTPRPSCVPVRRAGQRIVFPADRAPAPADEELEQVANLAALPGRRGPAGACPGVRDPGLGDRVTDVRPDPRGIRQQRVRGGRRTGHGREFESVGQHRGNPARPGQQDRRVGSGAGGGRFRGEHRPGGPGGQCLGTAGCRPRRPGWWRPR